MDKKQIDLLIDITLAEAIKMSKDHFPKNIATMIEEGLSKLVRVGLKGLIGEAYTTRMNADGVTFTDHKKPRMPKR